MPGLADNSSLARLVTKQALRERFLPFYGGTVNFTDVRGALSAKLS